MSTKPKARIRFVKFEKALAMQVLEMDERFRAENLDTSKSFVARNGVRIVSSGCPQLRWPDRPAVYLQGTLHTKDDLLTLVAFNTNKERDRYLADCIEALKEWAKDCDVFKDGHCVAACNATCDDITIEV